MAQRCALGAFPRVHGCSLARAAWADTARGPFAAGPAWMAVSGCVGFKGAAPRPGCSSRLSRRPAGRASRVQTADVADSSCAKSRAKAQLPGARAQHHRQRLVSWPGHSLPPLPSLPLLSSPLLSPSRCPLISIALKAKRRSCQRPDLEPLDQVCGVLTGHPHQRVSRGPGVISHVNSDPGCGVPRPWTWCTRRRQGLA